MNLFIEIGGTAGIQFSYDKTDWPAKPTTFTARI